MSSSNFIKDNNRWPTDLAHGLAYFYHSFVICIDYSSH